MSLADFEDILDPGFSPAQFSNSLLKAVNPSYTSATTLDIGTPLKKISFDLKEIDSRIESTIKSNSSQIISQLAAQDTTRNTIQTGLSPSLRYLSLSYKRLQDEIISPYERATELQAILGRVHQTSALLRNAIICIHLIKQLPPSTSPATATDFGIEESFQLASLHSKIALSLNENTNLKTLRVIKELDTNVVVPHKKQLMSFLSLQLSKECLKKNYDDKTISNISTLCSSLHMISLTECYSRLYKIIMSMISSNAQMLSKTLNSINDFNPVFKECLANYQLFCKLESILGSIRIRTDSNLLTEYLDSQTNITNDRSKSNMSLKAFYWTSLSSNFKTNFEISYNRGGPVGKLLAKNKDQIISTIKEVMSTSQEVQEEHIALMLDAVSILNQ